MTEILSFSKVGIRNFISSKLGRADKIMFFFIVRHQIITFLKEKTVPKVILINFFEEPDSQSLKTIVKNEVELSLNKEPERIGLIKLILNCISFVTIYDIVEFKLIEKALPEIIKSEFNKVSKDSCNNNVLMKRFFTLSKAFKIIYQNTTKLMRVKEGNNYEYVEEQHFDDILNFVDSKYFIEKNEKEKTIKLSTIKSSSSFYDYEFFIKNSKITLKK